MALLEVQDIHTYYGDSHVLQGVSLQVEKGSVVAVLGRNGMGKTTLIHSVIGFTPPRQGKVVFKGQDITHRPTFEIARSGICLVPQGRRVFASLTVKENLDVAVQSREGARWAIKDVLSFFPRLSARFQSRGKNLSGGEQQMLACGRGLMGNPDLLLLDEPTEGLAPVLVRDLEQVIREIKARGLSMVLVEQNHSFALRLADYVYIMSRGGIVYGSTPQEMKENTEVKARYLGV